MKKVICYLSALLVMLSLVSCAWGCSSKTQDAATEGLSFYPVETEWIDGGPTAPNGSVRVLSWGVRHPLYQMFLTGEELETDLHTKRVVIPATHLGSPVVEIGTFNGILDYIEQQFIMINQGVPIPEEFMEAVRSMVESSHITEIESVSIPDTVTRISAEAFEGTAFFQNIDHWEDGCLYAGNCLIKVGRDAPKKLTVRKGTTSVFSYIGGVAGNGYPQEVVLPDGVKTIGSGFALSGLKKITIPKTVTKIEETAFVENSALEEIVVAPENPVFRSVGNCLCEGTTLIRANKEWKIPANAGIERIELSPGSIYGVDRIEIPEGVKEIVGFSDCSAEVVLPESLEKIGGAPESQTGYPKYTFTNCKNLTELILPEGVKEIEGAYFSCENLRYAVIGTSIESIISSFGGEAFEGIFYRGTEEEWSKVRLSSMDDVRVYFYSETGGENTWRFGADGKPVLWKT